MKCTFCGDRVAGLMSLLDRSPMPSNMFPKPSISESSNARSESNSFGGVAVLALLAVMARPLGSFVLAGCTAGAGDAAGEENCGSLEDLMPTPKEKVRAEFRRNPGLADGGGGTGMSLKAAWTLLSDRLSIDEGVVEVLNRVEDALLSYWPVDADLSVPPLPLYVVREEMSEAVSPYRLLASGRATENNSSSSG